MTKDEHDKIVHLLTSGALQGIDTGRLDGKCEDVIPLEDAIAIIDKCKAEQEPYKVCDQVTWERNILIDK